MTDLLRLDCKEVLHSVQRNDDGFFSIRILQYAVWIYKPTGILRIAPSNSKTVAYSERKLAPNGGKNGF